MSSFWAFLGISLIVIITPGPDTAMTIRNALLGGRSGGIATAFGVAAGQAIWALATSVGLVAVLLASEPLFLAVKWAGAGYLIWLGAQALFAAWRGDARSIAHDGTVRRPRLGARAAFRQGVISDLGNPKMAVFFASVLPQFAPQGEGMFSGLIALGLVFSLLTLLWLVAYALALAKAGDIYRGSAIRRTIEGLTGAVLIALGLRLATEQR